MEITLSVDNLNTHDALSCEPFEVRRAFVMLSREGVVTVQTISESQNDLLKDSLEFFEVPTDVDCNALMETLQDRDIQKLLGEVRNGCLEDEKYDEEYERQKKIGFEKDFVFRTPEPDEAYEASMTLAMAFSDLPLF